MTVLGGGMFGGGADGRKVDPWPVESTVTRCNESLTWGKKILKAKANKKKKMGAKCNTRREPGLDRPSLFPVNGVSGIIFLLQQDQRKLEFPWD